MINYPLTTPASYGIATMTWGPMTATARARNPFTFADITQVFDGNMWNGTLTISDLGKTSGRDLAGWITALRGMRGTFLLGEPGNDVALGSAVNSAGAPIVAVQSLTGSVLTVAGLPTSVSNYLLRGDNFQLGSGSTARLHKNLVDVGTDGSGVASLDMWPPIRTVPNSGATVVVANAQGVFSLAKPVNPWQISPPSIYNGVTLEVVEVVP